MRTDARFTPPPVAGRHVRLAPVTPGDYGMLQRVELEGTLGMRWRFRGTTPSPEQWAHALWEGVLAQFLVVAAKPERPVGLVMAYRPNFQDGHVHLGAARFEPDVRSPLMLLGTALFVEYLFTCWPFHKLYLEAPEYNYDQFASGLGRYFELEGRLKEHSFFANRRWDQLFLALYRAVWEDRGRRWVDLQRAPAKQTLRVRVPAGVVAP